MSQRDRLSVDDDRYFGFGGLFTQSKAFIGLCSGQVGFKVRLEVREWRPAR